MTILGQTKSFPKRIFLPESVLFLLENFLIFWAQKREVCWKLVKLPRFILKIYMV